MDERPRTGLHARRVPLLRALLVAAALTGLFAMHGLDEHGTHEAEAGPDHTLMVMADAGHVTTDGMTTLATVAASADPAGMPGSMAMGLCLAVLLVLLALRAPSARGLLRLIPQAARSGPDPRPAARRDRDPPRLDLLSICRC